MRQVLDWLACRSRQPAGAGYAARCRWLRVAVAAVAAVAAGCSDRFVTSAVPRPLVLGAANDAPMHMEPADAKAVRDLHAFALNFLLVPLLDADLPDRWADPRLTMSCDDAQVLIDGAVPLAGGPVAARSFTVHWQMQRCSVFAGPFSMTGAVTLHVAKGAEGYTARVSPQQLQIATADGMTLVSAPFTAHLQVAR